MDDPHIVLIVLAAPGSYARKGQRIRLDAVSDSTPKVSRILQQVMYFEDREFVLRPARLKTSDPAPWRNHAAAAGRLPSFIGEPGRKGRMIRN
jgi:hypothetical protein